MEWCQYFTREKKPPWSSAAVKGCSSSSSAPGCTEPGLQHHAGLVQAQLSQAVMAWQWRDAIWDEMEVFWETLESAVRCSQHGQSSPLAAGGEGLVGKVQAGAAAARLGLGMGPQDRASGRALPGAGKHKACHRAAPVLRLVPPWCRVWAYPRVLELACCLPTHQGSPKGPCH